MSDIAAGGTFGFRTRRGHTREPKAFWHLCPDFVIEVKSDSDRLKPRREKMQEYQEQGAQLGWLINPENQTIEIFRPNGEVEKRNRVQQIAGEGPMSGFVLDLTYVWDPLAD